MAAKSYYLDNALLSAVLRNASFTSPSAVYAALYTVIPTVSFTSGTPTGTEVSDANYTRQSVTFSAPSNGTTSNSGTAVAFFGAGAAGGPYTIVAVGILDALTVGNLLYFGSLTVSKTVSTGDTLQFASTALSVSET